MVNKIKNTQNFNLEQFTKDLNEALDKVPYHPDLLYQLFKAYAYGSADFDFVYRYCQRLDQDYLQNHQELLVEFCMTCSSTEDLDFLYSLIPNINEKKYSDLFSAVYFIDSDDYPQAEKYILSTLKNDYKLKSSVFLQKNIFQLYTSHLASIEGPSQLYEMMTKYKEKLRSFKLDIETYFILIETAIIQDDLDPAGELINQCAFSSFQNFNYISIAKSYLYSLKGNEDLAVVFLESALSLDDSAFNVILNETDGFSIFSLYIKAINDLKRYDTKVRLVAQMLDFFEGKALFTLRTKLYQSVLYAAKDIEKAQGILNSCKDAISAQDYTIFQSLIQIEKELHKKNTDYKIVDKIIENFKPILNELDFIKLKVDFRSDVNVEKKAFYFGAEQMAKDLSQFIEFIDDEEKKRELIILNIKTIALYDLERANEELDKLGLDATAKLLFTEDIKKTMAIDTSIVREKSIKGINGFDNLKTMLIDFIMALKIDI
ncbi:hypothetical protein OAB88_06130 [Winogradskyella sp.]|nr:hypothetical protein [Winogradskyella sp.]MDC1505555.1 hypothetical protein [Winogradskyella sp.]